MATASTGWYCSCAASITSSTDTTATITVTSYWQNDGWNYDINNVSSWVYCGSSSHQVMNGGSVNTTSSNTAKQSLGSYSFVVNKTTSTQTVNCYAKITSSSSYVSGTKDSSTISITVPAKTSYTVSYNANGGSDAPNAQTKWHGTALTLSSTKPTRSGYTFVGWGTSTSDTTADYSAGGSYTANASDTLYAIWEKTITLTYNANGGNSAPDSQEATVYNATTNYKFTISSTKPTRTGYTFLGWSTSNTATSSSYAVGGTITLSNSDTLYAVWSENKLTVNYYSNYATESFAESLNVVGADKNVIVRTSDFSYDNDYSANGHWDYSFTDSSTYLGKTGYTATGYWGTSSDGGTLVKQSTGFATGQAMAEAVGKSLKNGNASVNLYAQWQINTYSFTYDSNGGSGNMGSQAVNWNDNFILSNNIFKREGYKFIGWNAYRNADNKWYVVGQGWLTEDEITLNGYEKKIYKNQDELTFNESWIKGDEKTISQYTMYAVWEISGVVYIDNGIMLEPYLAYIDNGVDWDLYLMYIDNGIDWNIIS